MGRYLDLIRKSPLLVLTGGTLVWARYFVDYGERQMFHRRLRKSRLDIRMNEYEYTRPRADV